MTRVLYGPDGYPAENSVCLERAIREIPGCQLTESQVGFFAELLVHADSVGREEDLPNSRPASRKQNEAALIELHKLCDKLFEHIDTLPREACEALAAQGLQIHAFSEAVGAAKEIAGYTFGTVRAPSLIRQRPNKNRARLVADEAANIYVQVSGVGLTYTTPPNALQSPRRTGPWPTFLAKVFTALGIRSQTDAHVERLQSQFSHRKTGTKLT